MVIFIKDGYAFSVYMFSGNLVRSLKYIKLIQYFTNLCKQHCLRNIYFLMYIYIIYYSVMNDAVCPKTYQAQLTVVGFTADHSGIYTVTIENRAGVIIEQFERSVEGQLFNALVYG